MSISTGSQFAVCCSDTVYHTYRNVTLQLALFFRVVKAYLSEGPFSEFLDSMYFKRYLQWKWLERYVQWVVIILALCVR